MYSKQFWSDTAERVLRTGAQAFLAAAGVSLGLHGLSDVRWIASLDITGGAMLLALITALIGGKVASPDDGSFTTLPAPVAVPAGAPDSEAGDTGEPDGSVPDSGDAPWADDAPPTDADPADPLTPAGDVPFDESAQPGD